jgi:hypothetical protein
LFWILSNTQVLKTGLENYSAKTNVKFMKLRGFRIDKKTGKHSLKDQYSPSKTTDEDLADYVPSPTKDVIETWNEEVEGKDKKT